MPFRKEYITENGVEYQVRTDSKGRYWLLDGWGHREHGPAIEYATGTLMWLRHSVRHREDGPAIVWSKGAPSWFWNGIDLTKEVQEQGIDLLPPEEIRFWLPILAAHLAE